MKNKILFNQKTNSKLKTIFLVLILNVTSVFAQDSLRTSNSDSVQFEIKRNFNELFEFNSSSFTIESPECPYSIKNALKDIEKDSMSIIIHGSFTGFDNYDKSIMVPTNWTTFHQN